MKSDQIRGQYAEVDPATGEQRVDAGRVAELEARDREAALSIAVGAALTGSGTLRETLQLCVEAVVEQLDAAFARVWTLNQEEQVLELQASAGLYTHIDGPHGRVPVGRFKIGKIAEERQAHLTNAVLEDPRVSDKEWARREGMVAFAGYPLMIENRVVGVLAMFARHTLPDRTLGALAAVSDGIASTIGRREAEAQREQLLVELDGERRRLFEVFMQAPAAISVTEGPDHVGVVQNEMSRLLAGRSTLGVPARETIPELAGQGLFELLDQVYESGTPWSARAMPISWDRDGDGVLEDGHFDVFLQPLRDRGGRVYGILSMSMEVSEQFRLQRELERERNRIVEVFQRAPAAVAVTEGSDHVFRVVNPLFQKLLGEHRTLVGRPLREALPELEDQGFHDLLDGVFSTGEAFEGREMPARIDRTGDGAADDAFFNFVYQPLLDSSGTVTGIMIHAVDVTDQVDARREVERRAEELARLATALERSNAELDQFAYVASHDLKAPLRGIANLGQWIEEDVGERLTDESAEHLRLLQGRVRRMEALIDGILDYSRAGRTRSSIEPIDTARMVADTLDLLDMPDSVRVDVADGLPVVRAERTPLQQVFLNLISNAVKYTAAHRSDPHITISCTSAHGVRSFSVSDNGPGIAAEYHDRIWGIFQTLDARDKVEGTGVGLSVVRKIVESRGGRVWLESEAGAGATFSFTWPDTSNAE